MSYTKLTDFAAKDALLSGNPSKVIRGTEIGAEFDAIESAMAAAEAVNITAPIIAASTSKTTPVNADVLPILDSAAANILKKVTWANIKATLKTYFDTLYAAVGAFAASGANADITSLSALTNGIVGTAGNQTIAGVKTFSSSPIAPTPASNDISTAVATTAFANPANSKATSGYVKLPSGVIIQWGYYALTSSGVYNNFPIAFPTACFSFVAHPNLASNPTSNNVIGSSVTTTQFAMWAPATNNVFWMAIGH